MIEPDENENENEGDPLWAPDDPVVGQIVTIAGSSVQARWTGLWWEVVS